MLGSDLIRQVSLDLNDQEPGYEYARWPYAQLQTYMQEAMNYIALNLKDLFTERVVVQLETGDGWQSACACTKILRIVGECTADGRRILKRLRRMSDDESLVWTGRSQNCNETDLNSYSLSALEDNLFAVYPGVSVSDRKSHYVLVECYAEPDVSGDGWSSPGEETDMIAKQWMLYRAMSVDSENNPTILQLAGQHQQEFHNLLQLSVQRKILEEAKYGGVRSVSQPSSE